MISYWIVSSCLSNCTRFRSPTDDHFTNRYEVACFTFPTKGQHIVCSSGWLFLIHPLVYSTFDFHAILDLWSILDVWAIKDLLYGIKHQSTICILAGQSPYPELAR